jgi:hypothetical protein
MALIPRSERAKLIDFVKFRGVVEGSLRSAWGLEWEFNDRPNADEYELKAIESIS